MKRKKVADDKTCVMRSALITTPNVIKTAFLKQKEEYGKNIPLVCVSGAFDPFHYGHLCYIRAAAMLKGENGLLVAIVNGDDFLRRKKNFTFMPIKERMELVAAFYGVDYVVPWDDGTQTVSGCIDIIRPNIFAKGGSKTEVIPEQEMCEAIKCAVVFGIGGDTQVQSSTKLVQESAASCSLKMK